LPVLAKVLRPSETGSRGWRARTLTIFATLMVLPVTARAVEVRTADALSAAVRSYRAAHELAILREFADLLAIPNVASDEANIRRNAAAIVSLLEKRGVRARLLEAAGSPPVVYGELAAPGARRTAVFYAHYDGQPVDPPKWATSPWKPVIRNAPLERGGKEVPWNSLSVPVNPEFRLYARSAGDDKMAIVGLLAALDAMKAAAIPPSINVKFFFEGEEEAGSPHLADILRTNASHLRSDVWFFCDGPAHPSGRRLLFFGARGITDVEITAYGAVRRLHSGHYGNWSPNPAVELARIVASMRDDEGGIRIPGFADDVRPPTEAERRAIAETPEVDDFLKRELGLARTEGGGQRLEERILLPALNVRGLSSGDVGEKATNSIPTEATVSIDFRLVPDQTPDKVRAKVEAHLQRLGYFLTPSAPEAATRLAHPRILKITWGAGYPPARTPMDLPVSRAVARVLSEGFPSPAVRLPTLGGSGPSYLFETIVKAPVVGVALANHDDNQHAANENLRIGNLWDAIETYAALMARLGETWR
jgi:acetylornithine deacetylase/succinyl-diaminopimelate desuccinylase-like protein